MKRGELKIRGSAAMLTIGFMALVKPDPNPSMIGIGITAVLMYEGLTFCIDYIRRINQKKKEDHYITVSRQDMKRWADEWITPAIREVR